MKALYWRPSRVSRIEMALIALVALAGFLAVERFKTIRHQPYYKEKMEAARLAESGLALVKAERLKRGVKIDSLSDPAGTYLIGVEASPVTSNYGNLVAKQTTVNPNFGAVVVQMLREAGVNEGDVIGVGMSGSFPALNVAVLAAAKAMKLKPLIVLSAAASQFGANDPNFMWIDMQTIMRDRGLFPFEILAATRGGVDDRATAMPSEARDMLDAAIARNHVTELQVHDYVDSIGQRMAIYRTEAAGAPIKAYINVGGGSTSVGTKIGKQAFKPGLNLHTLPNSPMVPSVMHSFINEGVPVIHLEGILQLAIDFNLPEAPVVTPAVGEGGVFTTPAYNTTLAAVSLLVILACMVGFLRMDLAMSLLRGRPRPPEAGAR